MATQFYKAALEYAKMDMEKFNQTPEGAKVYLKILIGQLVYEYLWNKRRNEFPSDTDIQNETDSIMEEINSVIATV
jgi:hypothetical protein